MKSSPLTNTVSPGDELAQLLTRGMEAFFAGDRPCAESTFRSACVRFPDSADAYNNLGTLLRSNDSIAKAVQAYARAAELNPTNWAINLNLGECLVRKGEMELALEHLSIAVQEAPGCARAWFACVQPLAELDRIAEARQILSHACTIDPQLALKQEPASRSVIAKCLLRQGDTESAFREMIAAFAVWYPGPDSMARAACDLGLSCQHEGRIEEAITWFHVAQQLCPEYLPARSNLFWCYQYCHKHTGQDSYRSALAWASEQQFNSLDFIPLRTKKRIKVGYLSPEFREHPVAYCMGSMLRLHDRSKYEIFLYSNALFHDATSDSLKSKADGWLDVSRMSDKEAALAIRKDGIDILVDLAGHTENNRIGVFGLRAAPIQAQWLGYYATSGVSQMDYFICNPALIPPAEECDYVERPMRVIGKAFSFDPPRMDILVPAPPYRANGFVTFGCHNYLAKVNSEVLDAWCEILNAVPKSRFAINRHAMAHPANRRRYLAEFESRGISPERISLFSTSSRQEYLESLGELDIFLDTFPFNGGTSIYEALWMGLPVITKTAPKMVGHFGESILNTLGYPEWVAKDTESYIDIAVRMASTIRDMEKVRWRLRDEFTSSSLCDAKAFTAEIEDAFDQMIEEKRAA